MKIRKTEGGKRTPVVKPSYEGATIPNPDIYDPKGLTGGILSVVRFQKIMETCNVDWDGISEILARPIHTITEVQRLSTEDVRNICEYLRVSEDYLYCRKDNLLDGLKMPLNYEEEKQKASEVHQDTSHHEAEIAEKLKTWDGFLEMFTNEYLAITGDVKDVLPVNLLKVAANDFVDCHDLEDGAYPDLLRLTEQFITKYNIHRSVQLNQNLSTISYSGVKLKRFINSTAKNGPGKSMKFHLAQSSKPYPYDGIEPNLTWPDRIKSRMEVVGISRLCMMTWLFPNNHDCGYIKTSVITNHWFSEGMTQKIAWMLKTTVEYLIGAISDPDIGADAVTVSFGGDKYKLIDGTKCDGIPDEKLTQYGIPEYMLEWFRGDQHMVPKTIANRIAKRANCKIIDGPDTIHEKSLLTVNRKETEEIVEAAVESPVTSKPAVVVTETNAVMKARRKMKSLINNNFIVSKADTDIIILDELYDWYLGNVTEAVTFNAFKEYMKSRGGKISYNNKEFPDKTLYIGIRPKSNITGISLIPLDRIVDDTEIREFLKCGKYVVETIDMRNRISVSTLYEMFKEYHTTYSDSSSTIMDIDTFEKLIVELNHPTLQWKNVTYVTKFKRAMVSANTEEETENMTGIDETGPVTSDSKTEAEIAGTANHIQICDILDSLDDASDTELDFIKVVAKLVELNYNAKILELIKLLMDASVDDRKRVTMYIDALCKLREIRNELKK